MPIVEAWKAHSKVFVLPIKIQTKRDVMQETFSLFHGRDKASDRPVTSRGEGGGRLTFTELSSSNHTISSSSPDPPQQRHWPMAPTFVFLQNVLIRLEVFLLVRERTCLSHNPSPSDWTFTSGGQGRGLRVSACVCVHVRLCVRAEVSGVIGAVVAPKETP